MIRDDKLNNHDVAIREGLTKIRSTGADIVLIDPQFAPKVIVKPEAARMVELIECDEALVRSASTAKLEDVDLFPRFEVRSQFYCYFCVDFFSGVMRDSSLWQRVWLW